MSTIGYESWAVDIADVGAIYPFQGGEVLMVIIGFVIWIAWHVVQIKMENEDIADDLEKARSADASRDIDDY